MTDPPSSLPLELPYLQYPSSVSQILKLLRWNNYVLNFNFPISVDQVLFKSQLLNVHSAQIRKLDVQEQMVSKVPTSPQTHTQFRGCFFKDFSVKISSLQTSCDILFQTQTKIGKTTKIGSELKLMIIFLPTHIKPLSKLKFDD
jgi:hypothetical protein